MPQSKADDVKRSSMRDCARNVLFLKNVSSETLAVSNKWMNEI